MQDTQGKTTSKAREQVGDVGTLDTPFSTLFWDRELSHFLVLYFIFSITVMINKERKTTGFKYLQLSCKEITQVIWKSQMSASLSKISTCYLVKLDLLKKMNLLQMFWKNIFWKHKASIPHVRVAKFPNCSEHLF